MSPRNLYQLIRYIFSHDSFFTIWTTSADGACAPNTEHCEAGMELVFISFYEHCCSELVNRHSLLSLLKISNPTNIESVEVANLPHKFTRAKGKQEARRQ